MHLEQNKLLSLWRVLFTEKGYAWQQLRAFVINNGDKKNGALLAYFEPFAPHFLSNRKTKISAIEAYKALYKGTTPPSENLRRDRIYHAVSELFALTERFLLAKAADTDPLVPPYQVLLQLYTHHNLQEHFVDYWRALQQKQAAALVTERSVFESFYLAEAYAQFQLFNNRAEVGKALHLVDNALHSLIFTNVLRYSVSVFTAQSQLNEQFSNVFLPMTLAYIEANWAWAQQYPMLYVNYEIYKLVEKPDKARLQRGLLLFKQYENRFSVPELRALYINIENIAAYIINQNTADDEAYLALLTIYNQEIDQKIFLQDDNLLGTLRFRNYVAVALRCKQTKQAADFITHFQQYLNEKERDDNTRYATSLVLFQQAAYKKVIENLRFKQFAEEDSHLRSQIVFLKAWFELEEAAHHKAGRHTEFETLKRIEEFEQMITQTKTLAEAVQEKFLRFATAFRQMIALTETDRKGYAKASAKADCAAWIKQQEGLLERNWLLEKINAL